MRALPAAARAQPGDTIRGMEPDHRRLITVRAAADRLGVGYSTFKRWVLSGRVRTTLTAGGHHRISEGEMDRLQARQQPSPTRTRPATAAGLDGLSARNQLHGFVDEVRIDGLLAQVRLRVGDQSLTAVITADAVRALKLRRGDDAVAIVKSTEVMIAKAHVAAGSRAARRKA
jgi:molybdopterin-binding protein